MSLLIYIIIFTLIGGVFSLIGGLLLLQQQKIIERFSLHFITFAAGALLATAWFDLIPESYELLANRRLIFPIVLFGIVAVFSIERIFLSWHHRHSDQSVGESTPWLITVTDSIHNFIDGVAIATAFFVSLPTGILTALAVVSHEIPHEIGDMTIMLHWGWTKRRTIWVNILSALTSTVGGVIAYIFQPQIQPLAGWLLSIVAGMFIYIALSDLIPEINRQTRRDKAWHVIILLLAGIVTVWWLMKLLE